MTIHRYQFQKALLALGNAEVLVGAFNSAVVSVPGAAVDPAPGNTGNGTVGSLLGKANAPSEVITLVATSATSFTVTGSLSGSLGVATVGTPFTSAIINLTITAGATPFAAGDNFTITVTAGAGNWTSLGAKEGAITESIAWRTNELRAEEHTGGVPHQATVVLDNFTFAVPIIAGDEDLWSKIEPTGSKDGVSDNPVDVITTSVFLIPQSEIPEPAGLSYNGTLWTPAAPKNSLFFPRAYVTHGDVSRPYDDGGKSVIEVTFHPMYYAAGPAGKRLYVRGDPVAAGYTDFRM